MKVNQKEPIVLTEEQTVQIRDFIKKGQVRIMFSSQTGNGTELAQHIQYQLESNNVICQVYNLSNSSSIEYILKDGVNILITSTYFQGLFPSSVQTNIKNFFNADNKPNPNCFYFVIGLGSSRYKYFNKAAIDLDEYMKKVAVCFNNAVLIDHNLSVSKQQQLQSQLTNLTPLFGFEIDWAQQQVILKLSYVNYPIYRPVDKYLKCELLQRQQLSFNVVDGIQSLYTFEYPQPVHFLPGSLVAILPRNSTADVYKLLNNSKIYLDDNHTQLLQPEDLIQWKQTTKTFSLSDGLYSLVDILYQTIDLSGPVTFDMIQQLKPYFSTQHQQFFGQQFTNRKEMIQSKLFDRIHTGQLFASYPSLKITLHQLLDILPAIKPRQYSIASGPGMSKDKNKLTFQLLITDIIWSNNHESEVYGLSTGFLKECSECKTNQMEKYHMNRNKIVYISFLPGLVQLDTDSTTPLLCIGLGSGMAPFRSYIQLRATKQIKNTIVLFLGIRRKSDYNELLQELVYYVQAGICKAYVALSRERHELYENPVLQPLTFYYESHIQNCLKQQTQIIGEYMSNPESYTLYCGKSGSVVDEVKQILRESIDFMGKEQADKLWNDKMNSGQISIEAW